MGAIDSNKCKKKVVTGKIVNLCNACIFFWFLSARSKSLLTAVATKSSIKWKKSFWFIKIAIRIAVNGGLVNGQNESYKAASWN